MAKPVYFIKFGTKSKRVSTEIGSIDALLQLFRNKFEKVLAALPFGGEGAEFSFNINDPAHGERYELEDIDDLYDGARIEVDLDNEAALKAKAQEAADAEQAKADALVDAKKAEQEAAAAATAAAMAAVARSQQQEKAEEQKRKQKEKADAEKKRKAAAKQKAPAAKKKPAAAAPAAKTAAAAKPVPMTDDAPAAATGKKSPAARQKRKAPESSSPAASAAAAKGGASAKEAAAAASTPAKKKTKKQDGAAAASPTANGAAAKAATPKQKAADKKDTARDRRSRDRDNRRTSQGGRDHDRGGGARRGDSAKKNGGFSGGGGGRGGMGRAEPPEDLGESIDFLVNGHPAHIRGLSFAHTENDLMTFFDGIDIMHNGIFILKNPKDITRATGEGYVAFATEADLERGMRKNREHLGARYIEVRRSTRAKMKEAMSRAKEDFRIVNLPLRPGTFLVKMHGLPFGCKNDEVHAFFESLSEQPVGVHRILDTNSKPTRIAFAEFLTENGFREALKLDRHYVGSRYVNLTEASPADMRKAMGLFEGTQSRCLRLWGVPHDAADDDISKFFNERVDIIPMRIHRKRGGLEAFVEFATESDTRTALTLNKSHMGNKWIDMRAVEYERMANIVGLPPVRGGGGGGDHNRGGGNRYGPGGGHGGGGGGGGNVRMRDDRMRGPPGGLGGPASLDVRGGGFPMRGGPRESRFGPPSGQARGRAGGPPPPAALGGGMQTQVGFGGVNQMPLGGGAIIQPQAAALAAQPMIHDVRGPAFRANIPFGQSASPMSASSAPATARYPAITPSVGGGPRGAANRDFRSGRGGGGPGRSPPRIHAPRIHDVRDQRRHSMGGSGGGSGMNGRNRNERGNGGGSGRFGDRRASHGGGGGGGGGNGPTLMQIDGVPYDASRGMLIDFFRGFGVIEQSVEMLMEKGRPIGTAMARFQTPRDAANALQARDRQYIGKRYVKLKLLPGK